MLKNNFGVTMNKKLFIITAWTMMLFSLSACVGGNPEAGKQKSVVCQSCHGTDGNSTNPQFPRLAGQYPDYLANALADYKSGQRKNAIMASFAAKLSERDMEDIASYFARQKPSLTVKR
jgi:cytochrome c553